MIMAAFVGSMISMGFVLLVSRKVRTDVHAGHLRRYDRLYLFGCDGFCRNLCR